MATIDHFNDEIRTLQEQNVEWETQLTNILNEEMGTEQKNLMIKFFGDRIVLNDKVIAAKKIEDYKVIAAKKIEKEKQITADKQYRLERVVWSAVATVAGWRFNWSWPDDFKTTYPDLSEGLYLLIHLIASCSLVSNGLVEYLAKFGLGLWYGNANKENPAQPAVGGGGENEPLVTQAEREG